MVGIGRERVYVGEIEQMLGVHSGGIAASRIVVGLDTDREQETAEDHEAVDCDVQNF